MKQLQLSYRQSS